MSHMVRLAVLSFAALSSFFNKNTYASNLELEELRHSHLSTFWRKHHHETMHEEKVKFTPFTAPHKY